MDDKLRAQTSLTEIWSMKPDRQRATRPDELSRLSTGQAHMRRKPLGLL